MTWRETIAKAGAYLQAKAVPDAQVAAELLAARLLKTGRGTLAAHLDEAVPEKWLEAMRRGMARLANGEPVQYVIGEWDFRHLTLKCDRRALIPRPETEGLVQKVAEELALKAGSEGVSPDKPLRIWDVGTGSGCIAIALAKRFPQAEVKAFEVSESAMMTACANAEFNEVKIDFILDDVLHPQSEVWQEPVDLVVSNPPYIRESERSSMERNVLDHEPHAALFVPDDDPLLFYRQILTLAKPQLTALGSIWFEINETLGEEMVRLGQNMGFNGVVLEDYHGKPRFVSLRKA